MGLLKPNKRAQAQKQNKWASYKPMEIAQTQIQNKWAFLIDPIKRYIKKSSSSRLEEKDEGRMVGANLKAETKDLMEKRAAMETEMNSIILRLTQPGAPGLSGNLLDSEGFPLPNIDIPVVRAERSRLAELRNDHRKITDRINANIQTLHSVRPTSAPSSTKDSGNDVGSEDRVSPAAVTSLAASRAMDVVFGIPFAMVDEISESSPAAEDGLQLGDQVVKFGNVEAGDNLLGRLAAEAQSKEGEAIAVVVIRQGAVVNICVTPRTWQGRGLLGCHFRMM